MKKMFFAIIFLIMLGATLNAAFYGNIANFNVNEPWVLATLVDLYLMFFIFYAWVFAREKRLLSKIKWFIVIMTTGSMGVAVYLLKNYEFKKK